MGLESRACMGIQRRRIESQPGSRKRETGNQQCAIDMEPDSYEHVQSVMNRNDFVLHLGAIHR